MYRNNKVKLIIGKIDTSIPFEVGVKQGDSVAPVLIQFLMMAFVEVIEQEWDKHGIKIIEFKRHSNSPHSAGRVTSHPAKNFSQGTLFDIFCMLYVDDGAFAFIPIHDLEIGVTLLYDTFARFGLKMHMAPSKNNQRPNVYFPAPGHFKPLTLPPSSTDSHQLPIALQPKQ